GELSGVAVTTSPFPAPQRDGGRALRPYPRVLGADSEGGRDGTGTDRRVWRCLRRARDGDRASLPDRGQIPLGGTQLPPAREHRGAPRRSRGAGAPVGLRR